MNLLKSYKKQQGATLMTSLIFLVLMTVVSITATKVSINDVLVSGNNQQQMLLFQGNENELKLYANTDELADAINGGAGFVSNTTNPTEYRHNNAKAVDALARGHTLILNDMGKKYACHRDGVAMSIGPNAPPCDLYEFEVNSRMNGTSAREMHHKGVGKMVPPRLGKGVLF